MQLRAHAFSHEVRVRGRSSQRDECEEVIEGLYGEDGVVWRRAYGLETAFGRWYDRQAGRSGVSDARTAQTRRSQPLKYEGDGVERTAPS